MKNNTKVLGIGGIFFKCKNPDKINEWYSSNFGFHTDDYGTMFEANDANDPDRNLYLQWAPFSGDSEYFEPSKKEFMINYIVEDIESLVSNLKKKGVVVLDEIEEYEYGKFVHILDPENNKVELWEPTREVFKEVE